MELTDGQQMSNLIGEADTRVSRATLAAQVEDAIRLDIIAGVLEPGQRLRAVELTERYGVSATPLREALQRLAAENLVALGPRLGATVAPISETELLDIYALRRILDGVALERSIANGDDAWLNRVKAAYKRFKEMTGDHAPTPVELVAWSGLHRSFHDTLFDACDSPWLLRFVGVLSDHSERYRMLSHRRAIRHSLQEHRDIYVAVMARDTKAALAAHNRHLSATVDVLQDKSASVGSR